MARHTLTRRMPRLAACLLSLAFFAAPGASQGEADPQVAASGSEVSAPSVSPSKTVEALSKKEERRRLRELRKMANRWYGQRRRFPARCHHCDGRGTILVLHRVTDAPPRGDEAKKSESGTKRRKSARNVVRCPTCKGMRFYVSKKSFMKVYYEMMSPAFRRLPGAHAAVQSLYEQVRSGERPAPRKFSFATQKRAVLVTPTHGVAWHRLQGEKVWQSTFWVWAPRDGGKSTWFQYAAEADGDWPATGGDLPVPAGYPQLP